jgi:hypothetical protein
MFRCAQHAANLAIYRAICKFTFDLAQTRQ